MKYIDQYLEEVVKLKPLGKVTYEDDCQYDLSGVYVYVDGKCTDLFIAHVDYLNWLENKFESLKKFEL